MARPVWLVLPDPFPTRVFVDCGIVEKLAARLPGEVEAVLALPADEAAEWAPRLGGAPWTLAGDLFPRHVGVVERIERRIDLAIDRNAGYYPLSVRHSLRNGFHAERMRPGHPNLFLNSSLTGRLPDSERLDERMRRWLFSTRRYVSKELLRRMRESCSALIVANVQSHRAVAFLNAARRLELPTVGYVASWDHTVGKGIVSPHVTSYVVQNAVMRDDLVRYHRIPEERIVVTGWPQSDVFHRQRPRTEYEEIVRGLGLDPSRPVVLAAGNTPTNAPYEGRFVERLVEWSQSLAPSERPQLLFRPHPRDTEWRERFAAALNADDTVVQEPSYTDIEVLSTLLQHVGCVVCNAGTILLDALVNDRPAVCVLYDEGAPEGERHAELNVTGKHYEELVRSGAFLRASDFGEVAAGIQRSLDRPGELASERSRIGREVVGEIDGHAADRVVDAIVSTVAPGP
ncbi:MAG TPA: CDP-glycerol glycerophosphotransferase family protein [Gaiellaceae bacterium]|nr:CDP-glycerol glycerophosphotransferase family protein [Gaiellaceae bacterium]